MANESKYHKVYDQKIYFQTSEHMDDLEDGSVDFVMTSPPYWNLKNYGSENEIGKEPYEEYLGRMQLVWDECYRVCKDDGVMVINVANRRHNKVFMHRLREPTRKGALCPGEGK